MSAGTPRSERCSVACSKAAKQVLRRDGGRDLSGQLTGPALSPVRPGLDWLTDIFTRQPVLVLVLVIRRVSNTTRDPDLRDAWRIRFTHGSEITRGQ
jgi:hypothetical protein